MSKVTVIGGRGAGAQAYAGRMALADHDVSLYGRPSSGFHDLQKYGRVNVSGPIFDGEFELGAVTTDMGEAVRDAEKIFVVTPAYAHGTIAEELSPHVEEWQTVIASPGRPGGAYEIRNVLERSGCEEIPRIVETGTLPFVCRTERPGYVDVKTVKDNVLMSVLPDHDPNAVYESLAQDFPEFKLADHPLETGLSVGPLFHTAGLLLNYRWREHPWNFYTDGMTPTVAKYIKWMDEERLAIASALGFNIFDAEGWLEDAYGTQNHRPLHEMFQDTEVYKGVLAPAPEDVFYHRYLREDGPYGLVPMISIADALGVKTPRISFILGRASRILGENLMETGRNLNRMGLTREEVQAMAT